MGRRERETRAENSDKLQGSIFIPSFQLKVPRSNCVQIALPSSSRANMLNFLNKNMKWVIMKTDVKINIHM